MKDLELSDKIVTVEMTVTQVGIALSAVHCGIKENEEWLENNSSDTEKYKEIEWFNKNLHDIAYNLATILQNAAEGESEK